MILTIIAECSMALTFMRSSE